MIKRIQFATRIPGSAGDQFGDRWLAAASARGRAPAGVRPRRVAVCISRPDVLADPAYDGIGIEWFDDDAHVHRFDEWLRSGAGESVRAPLEDIVVAGASPVLLADELVLRGADWLDDRWRGGGRKLKHMAIATRAAGLSPAEFSERWKGRPGQVAPAAGPVVAIPARARGCAYIQNHRRPGGGAAGCPPYDAVNEVYFDDLDALQFRIEWLARNLGDLRDGAEADLVSQAWFVAATEDVAWSE